MLLSERAGDDSSQDKGIHSKQGQQAQRDKEANQGQGEGSRPKPTALLLRQWLLLRGSL